MTHVTQEDARQKQDVEQDLALSSVARELRAMGIDPGAARTLIHKSLRSGITANKAWAVVVLLLSVFIVPPIGLIVGCLAAYGFWTNANHCEALLLKHSEQQPNHTDRIPAEYTQDMRSSPRQP